MEEELRLLGLIDVEIKIFLTLIKIGESLASDIAKKANVPRGSIYDVLERLEQKGMVSHVVKDYKKYFSAANPKTILEDLEYKKQRIKNILPQLEQYKKDSDVGVSKSEIYTGKEGMKTILNMVLEEKEIFVLGASRKTTEVLPYFMNHWFKERAIRKIKVKIIYNDTSAIRKSIEEHRENLYITKEWEMKFLHVDYLSDIMTVVFGEKVMLATWKKEEPSAILIQNKDIAETYKEYILNLWKIAKK
jgi:sugar-specific transcriptional regulator TrmB